MSVVRLSLTDEGVKCLDSVYSVRRFKSSGSLFSLMLNCSVVPGVRGCAADQTAGEPSQLQELKDFLCAVWVEPCLFLWLCVVHRWSQLIFLHRRARQMFFSGIVWDVQPSLDSNWSFSLTESQLIFSMFILASVFYSNADLSAVTPLHPALI